MILWRGVCPQNPYPMDLGTAKLSLRFKTSPLGTPIVHPDTRLSAVWMYGPNAGQRFSADSK